MNGLMGGPLLVGGLGLGPLGPLKSGSAADLPAGRRDRSIAARCARWGRRRSAANADSFTLSADVGSRAPTC